MAPEPQALLGFDCLFYGEFGPVCGVDEAGRGPLAGPVCVAAVILPPDYCPQGLDDSKKCSEKKREALYEEITQKALAFSVQLIDAEIIDQINILKATMQAMAQAVADLNVTPGIVLIDGNQCPDTSTVPCKHIIKGDGKSAAIAAASILAKVTRDRLMRKMDDGYPGYGFASHKGYGTKAHYKAIQEQGICPIHRKTFLKKVLGNG